MLTHWLRAHGATRVLPFVFVGISGACAGDPAGLDSSSAFAKGGPPAPPAPSIVGIELGGLGGSHSRAVAVAQSGLIGGGASPSGGSVQPVTFDGASASALPGLPSSNGLYGISDMAGGGAIAVGSGNVGTEPSSGFAWLRPSGGAWSSPQALPHLGGGGAPEGVNSVGLAVGRVHLATGPGSLVGGPLPTSDGDVAGLWNPPATDGGNFVLTEITGLPGCRAHSARAINDGGRVVGWSVCTSGGSNVSHPFTVAPGAAVAVALPMSGYSSVQAVDIAESGLIAGMGTVSSSTRAVLLWTPDGFGNYGAPERLFDIDANTGQVFGLNSCGTVVGRRASGREIVGFAYVDGQVMNLLAFSGWTQPFARAISDAGLVVGNSLRGGSKNSGYSQSENRATSWQVSGC